MLLIPTLTCRAASAPNLQNAKSFLHGQGAGVGSATDEAKAAWHTFFKYLMLLAPSAEAAAGQFAFMLQHPPLAPLAAELSLYFTSEFCPWLAARGDQDSERSVALLGRAGLVEKALRRGVQTVGSEFGE